ncbi:MAG: ABC transporter ATP-binding protein [Fuerstiella sp.]
MSKMLLELDQVTKLYGTVIGVNDFSMDLEPGAYGLLGPNGAGKSTLLNLLMGQLVPTRGTVKVMGELPRNNRKLMRQLGFCPGFEGMYARTNAKDWVTLCARLQGLSKSKATRRADECLELVGMANDMTRPISTYSRGMRQRTKLAQAIAHEPSFLILDEPFSGLDPIGRAEMTDVLRGWVEDGKSVIIASHVLHEIEALTDRFLLICGGRLLASGTAAEVNELLSETPTELSVDCEDAYRLGGLLVQGQLVDSMRIERLTHRGERLHLQTSASGPLMGELPNLIHQHHLTVYQVSSADDSLQTLFNSLMKIHRGEL